jgi:hypothetical protein
VKAFDPVIERGGSMSWQPWAGAHAGAASEALDAVVAALDASEGEEMAFHLQGGWAGLAICHAHVALDPRFGHPETRRAKALECLERAAEGMSSARSPWLFAGFTGVAWATDHLTELGVLTSEEDYNREIDGALLDLMSGELGSWGAEYMSGLAGLGRYALDRGGRGRSSELLDVVVRRIGEQSVATPEGLAWFTPPEALDAPSLATYPEGCFNLGLAHGVAGILSVLAEASAKGSAQAHALLRPAVPWLLAQRSPHADGSCFGKAFAPGQPSNPEGTRLAWCYGDLGTALALLRAGRWAGEPAWEAAGFDLALACTRRADLRKGIRDAPFCHGALGVAHLFARLHHATGEPRFLQTAEAFLGWGLTLRCGPGPAAGFYSWEPSQGGASAQAPEVQRPGVLMGAAGVGLVLLSALRPIAPMWDRLFLADLPTLG